MESQIIEGQIEEKKLKGGKCLRYSGEL